MTMLRKVLIANRAEIAVRVIRTCAELGISSVAVYSDADDGALHTRLADEAVHLAGTAARDTYLDAALLVEVANRVGADAVHPGYGLLSENATFAELVEASGLGFVGPSPEAIRALGDKVCAREIAAAAGVPVVPGLAGDLDTASIRSFGDAHGWPLVIKPALGGGGRGMRVVGQPEELEAALSSARSEALGAFGEDRVYVERYLEKPRHIEVQLFADRHGEVVALGDRDCSVQRRHQKLIEEAPAPGISEELRGEMSEAAIRIARQVGYLGAGTVEFLVDGGQFHFLEMNTRIQVEHPVTEAVLGVDLVREQLLVAGGSPLTVRAGRQPRGHAIECRINAEDPGRGFLPTPGPVEALSVPWLPGVRLDTGYEAGDVVPAHYDSLLAKLIVWGPDRDAALHRLRAVLDGSVVRGVASTLTAALAVVDHPDFHIGEVDIHWFEETVSPTLSTTTAAASTGGSAAATGGSAPASEPVAEPSSENRDGAWIGGRFHRILQASNGSASAAPRVRRDRVRDGSAGRAGVQPVAAVGSNDGVLTSPVQGTVTAVLVRAGDPVSSGDVVATVEAMKMESPVRAASDGTVTEVWVDVGDGVAAGAPLMTLAPRN
jgi:acetyl-CoA/propionyl-CoA carboxylase biotin carboxyl carrier protein